MLEVRRERQRVENQSLVIIQEWRKGQTYILANFQRAMWKGNFLLKAPKLLVKFNIFVSWKIFLHQSSRLHDVYSSVCNWDHHASVFSNCTLGISTWLLQSYPTTSKVKVRTFLWKTAFGFLLSHKPHLSTFPWGCSFLPSHIQSMTQSYQNNVPPSQPRLQFS